MNKKFTEATIKSESIYEGKIIKVRVDTVELPNQCYAKREIVEHSRGVGMVALTEDKEIFLVRQFRKPIEDMIYEIPAGLVEANESLQEAANRELQEEIGYRANKLQLITEAYPSPGFTDEKFSLFLATDLVESKLNLDDTEFIEVIKLPLNEAYQMIENFEIVDAKTIMGILFALKGLSL
ncbi:NUDIX hydrolase [Peptoniphilaceae bacterium SGI.131]